MSIKAGLAALGAAAMMAMIPSAANADSGQISVNLGSGWSHDSATPMFDLSRIAPGWSQSANVAVRNDSNERSVLTLSSSNIVDNENGCTHPERVVDNTCSGPDAGELGHAMVFSVYQQGQISQPLWSGTLYDLTKGATLDKGMPAGQIDNYRVQAELPMSSGNETQSDSVQFSLRLTLSGSTASATTEVKGVRISRSSGRGPVAAVLNELPFTGSEASRLIAGSLWMITGGALLLLCVRAFRRARHVA